MSLINQMLKDLEARQKNKNQTSPMSGLSAGQGGRRKKPMVSKKFLFIIIPTFAVIIGGLLFSGGNPTRSSKTLTPDIAAAKTPVTTQPPTAAAPTTTPETSASSATPIEPMNAPSGVQLHIDKVVFTPDLEGNTAKLIFTLTDNSHYYDFALQENGRVASVLFYNTLLTRETLASLVANPFFNSVTVTPKRYDTQVNIMINQGIEVAGLEMDENVDPPVLILSLRKSTNTPAPAPVPAPALAPASPAATVAVPAAPLATPSAVPDTNATPAPDGSMTKTNVPLTEDQMAERLRLQAVDLSRNGKMFEALNKLSKGMVTYPDYPPMVETLVTMLLEDKQTMAAQAMLNQGLARAPHYVPYIVLQARLLAAKGEAQMAIDTLNTISPTLEQSTDYYAVLAGLQQRVGNSDVAEQIYRELIGFDPENGLWWMGYGIALESNGKRNNAIEAYKRAGATGNLNSKLLMYSNSRIEALGG